MHIDINILKNAADTYITNKFKGLLKNSDVQKNILNAANDEAEKLRLKTIDSWFTGGKTASSVEPMSRKLMSSIRNIPAYVESGGEDLKVVAGIQYGTGVPHADTHIGEEGSVKQIHSKGKLLAVPKKGGPADDGHWFSVFQSPSLLSSAPFLKKFWLGKKHWVLGTRQGGVTTIFYWLKEMVTVPRRLFPSKIKREIVPGVEESLRLRITGIFK